MVIIKSKITMIIGSPNYLNGIGTKMDDILLVEFQESVGFTYGQNTCKFLWETSHRIKYCIINSHLSQTVHWNFAESNIFHEMRLDPELFPQHKYVVPLFLFSWTEDTDPTEAHIYSLIRFTIEDGLFIRTSHDAIEISGTPEATVSNVYIELFKEALIKHEENSLFLNNHQCYYKKIFKDIEVENKFLITSKIDDIWDMTVDFYHRIRNDRLRGYIPEYKDEFQAWDYWNYLYEVIHPPQEVGYISLIPTTDGKFTIKRKWYEQDTYMRKEHHYKQQVIDTPFKRYIDERFKVKTIEYPPFRRVRYDVNFESLRSGHVYGIFFDHSTINDHGKACMTQCEVEYLRSRTLISLDEQIVLDEMDEISEWVCRVLKELKVTFERTYYSKLSFLKDNAERRMSNESE